MSSLSLTSLLQRGIIQREAKRGLWWSQIGGDFGGRKRGSSEGFEWVACGGFLEEKNEADAADSRMPCGGPWFSSGADSYPNPPPPTLASPIFLPRSTKDGSLRSNNKRTASPQPRQLMSTVVKAIRSVLARLPLSSLFCRSSTVSSAFHHPTENLWKSFISALIHHWFHVFLCAHNHVKLQKRRHRKTQRLRRQSASGETLMLMRVVVSAAEGERKHLYSCLALLHLSFLIFCKGFWFGAPQGPPGWGLASSLLFAFSRFRLLLSSSCAAARFSIFDRQSFNILHHSLHSWPTLSTWSHFCWNDSGRSRQCTQRDFHPPKVGKSKGQHENLRWGHTERGFIILRDDKCIKRAGKHFEETFAFFWIMIHRDRGENCRRLNKQI